MTDEKSCENCWFAENAEELINTGYPNPCSGCSPTKAYPNWRSLMTDEKSCRDARLKREQNLARRQKIMAVYSDSCCFCKGTVTIDNLILHHIGLDGPAERMDIANSETAGFVHSYDRAVEVVDRTNYAVAHRICHTRFHNIQRLRTRPPCPNCGRAMVVTAASPNPTPKMAHQWKIDAWQCPECGREEKVEAKLEQAEI